MAGLIFGVLLTHLIQDGGRGGDKSVAKMSHTALMKRVR